MKKHHAEFVRIALLESIVEAQLMASILTERQVPHRIRSFHDTAYDGLFQMQKGWGELHAPQAFQMEVNEILNDIRQADHGTAAGAPEGRKIEP